MKTRGWLVLLLFPLGLVQFAFGPLRPASSAPAKLSGTSAHAAYAYLDQAIRRLQTAWQLEEGPAAPWISAAHESVSSALPLFANADESVQKRVAQVQNDLSHPEELARPPHRDLLVRALGDLHAIIDSQREAGLGMLAEARVSITPSSIDFGLICINEQARITVTVKNETDVVRFVSFAPLPEFVTVVSGLPATLNPGASAEVVIQFLAPQPSQFNNAVRLQARATGFRDADILVTFRGTAAPYIFAPDPLDFGEVGVGDTVSMDFTIRNCTSTDAPMTLKIDDFYQRFTLDGADPQQVVVPANGTLSIPVNFTAKKIGIEQRVLPISARINGRERVIKRIQMIGEGVAAVKVGARTLDFGTVPSGQLALRYCFFYNNTNLTQTVEIDGSHLPKTGPWGALGTGTRTLSPKDTGSVLVSFKSTRRGASTNKLIFKGAGIPRGKATLTLKARVR